MRTTMRNIRDDLNFVMLPEAIAPAQYPAKHMIYPWQLPLGLRYPNMGMSLKSNARARSDKACPMPEAV